MQTIIFSKLDQKIMKTSNKAKGLFFFLPAFSCELTISKCFSNIVLHFHYISLIEFGAIHELTLVGAACQLTEEVHQIEETGRTSVQMDLKKKAERHHNLKNNNNNKRSLKVSKSHTGEGNKAITNVEK